MARPTQRVGDLCRLAQWKDELDPDPAGVAKEELDLSYGRYFGDSVVHMVALETFAHNFQLVASEGDVVECGAAVIDG